MDISAFKEKAEEALLSSGRRIVITVFSLVVLVSIPITYSLVGQRFDIRQRASTLQPQTGTPSCEWSKPSVNPGETAELILVNYGNNLPNVGGSLSPVISPTTGYKFLGPGKGGNLSYELDAPGTTFTASLIDPNSTVGNSDIKTVATCIISTTTTAEIQGNTSAPAQTTVTQDAIISCMQEGNDCDPKIKQSADLYPDGVVDEKDLNMYLRNSSR